MRLARVKLMLTRRVPAGRLDHPRPATNKRDSPARAGSTSPLRVEGPQLLSWRGSHGAFSPQQTKPGGNLTWPCFRSRWGFSRRAKRRNSKMNKYLLATLWTLPLIYEVQAAPPPGFPVYDVEANCIQYLKQSDKKARERYEYK